MSRALAELRRKFILTPIPEPGTEPGTEQPSTNIMQISLNSLTLLIQIQTFNSPDPTGFL